MKKSNLIAVVLVALIFNACSSKEIDIVDENTNSIEKNDGSLNGNIQNINTDTVAQEEIIGENINNIRGSISSRIQQISSELGSIYFAFDKYDLQSSQEEKVVNGAKLLKSSSDLRLKIEGNCDEWGTDEYNYALGLKRAKSVKDALIAQGVSRSNMSIISYGESNPKCNSKTQECWRQNRRVDFQPVQ